MRALALAVLLVPSLASAQTRSDGILGPLPAAPAGDFHVEALRGFASYRVSQAGSGYLGAATGWVAIDGAERMRIVGARTGADANVRVSLAARDGTVVDLLAHGESGTVHLLGVVGRDGVVVSPRTLTDCTTVEDDRVRLDCAGIALDVRFVDDTSLSPRDRGWARAATMIEIGEDVWRPELRPIWVARDGSRARFAARVESSDPSTYDGSWDDTADTYLVDGEIEVTMAEGFALDGEPRVLATRTLDCGPPYRGCCSPPPRVCTVGPTLPIE